MSKQDINKDFYNQLYKKRNPLVSFFYSLISFDQQSKSKVNYKVIRNFFGKRFENKLAILDYGFGHGSLLLKYKRNHALYGCDISDEAVFNFPRVAKLTGKNVQTANVAEFEHRFKSVQFDVISLSHIIEHVDDDGSLIRFLSQKLSDTGVMLVNVPINEVWEDPKHVRKYDQQYLEALLISSNLQPVSSLECDKLTSFFLIEEKTKKIGRLKWLAMKFLRLAFAILPVSVTTKTEQIFLQNHNNQQLIMLAKRIKK